MNEMNDHSNPSTPLIDKNVTCNSECGLGLIFGQSCDGHKCHCISEIQPEVMSRSVSKRLAVQKPEQTEDDKIREAFEGAYPDVVYDMYIGDDGWYHSEDKKVAKNCTSTNRMYHSYRSALKQSQQEIERMKCCGNCDNYDICMFFGDHHCINWTIKESE